MSDPLTVLGVTQTTNLIEAGYRLASSSNGALTAINATGGVVLDTISLSAAAQQFLAAAPSAFTNRTDALTQLAKGQVSYFIGKDYSGAAFIGQNLDGAVFVDALLNDANFTAASLRGTQFINTAVDGARFNLANLTGADLSGATGLTSAQLQGALVTASTVLPAGIGTDLGNTLVGTRGAVI